MNTQQLEELCRRLHLGTPVKIPQHVVGGCSHQLWRIETPQGTYAVKQISAQQAKDPAVRAAYQHSERVAAAMAAAGIPALLALPYRNHPVQRIDTLSVLVYRWVEGQTLLPGSASSELVQQIGRLLSQMHTLTVTLEGLELPTWRVLRDDDWVLLSRRATAAQTSWAEAMRTILPELRWWSQLARDANPRLWKAFVVSHRHLEPSKVVWRDAQTPVILDWASAGLINPMLELVETALAWSRDHDKAPDQTRFQALVVGYRRAGGQLQGSIDDAVVGVLGRWLERLEFWLRRSLDDAPAFRSGEDQVWRREESLLCDFQQVAQAMSQVVSWVEAGLAP